MSETLGVGKWHNGRTKLQLVEDADFDTAEGYPDADGIAFVFNSTYDDDKQNPPSVAFTPKELRDLIGQTREEVGCDPFNSPTFLPLIGWFEENGDAVIAEVGEEDGRRKQFRMKENDDTGTVYLKVQCRWKVPGSDNPETWLRSSPTLGRGEFEGVFEEAIVL